MPVKKNKIIFTKKQAIQDIKESIKNLINSGIKIKKAFLFGSYANGTPKNYSDIDLALVSNDFEGIRFFDNKKIIYSHAITNDFIETHPYKTTEFTTWNPFVKEILRTGIRVW